jgi:hypothetical protein
MLTGAPENSAGGVSPSSWIGKDLFFKYIHYLKDIFTSIIFEIARKY